jgi:hypothetical protein
MQNLSSKGNIMTITYWDDSKTRKVQTVVETRNGKILLTAGLYLERFKHNYSHLGIKGGTIHDFLKDSRVKYYPSFKCPVYYVEHYHNGKWVKVGGNYAAAGKPKLEALEELNFA